MDFQKQSTSAYEVSRIAEKEKRERETSRAKEVKKQFEENKKIEILEEQNLLLKSQNEFLVKQNEETNKQFKKTKIWNYILIILTVMSVAAAIFSIIKK